MTAAAVLAGFCDFVPADWLHGADYGDGGCRWYRLREPAESVLQRALWHVPNRGTPYTVLFESNDDTCPIFTQVLDRSLGGQHRCGRVWVWQLDQPPAKWTGWNALEPAAIGGSLLLLDTRALPERDAQHEEFLRIAQDVADAAVKRSTASREARRGSGHAGWFEDAVCDRPVDALAKKPAPASPAADEWTVVSRRRGRK